MDSKALLIRQFETHAELLCDLLSSPCGEAVPAATLDQSVTSAHMLAGSMSVMGLMHWSELSSAHEALLARYRQGGFAWDERIADVTSELIEKLEAVAAAYRDDAAAALDGVIASDELSALIAELGVLVEETASMSPAPAPAQSAPTAPADAPQPVMPAVTADLTTAPASDEAPLPGVVAELRASFERVVGGFASGPWRSRDWSSAEVQAIRRELNTIDFCARSIEKVIGDRTGEEVSQPASTLTPLRVALGDFAAELAHGTGRSVAVELSGEELSIDPRLLSTTALVLQSLITDVFARSDRESLRIHVAARDASGAMRWSVRDDGNNFISDSPVDHDDQLAFYRGLRGVINLIGRHRSVLWVEPAVGPDGPRARFEFTLPASDTRDAVMVWGEGDDAFALRATQVCAVADASTTKVGDDEYGRFVDIDGGRVPLVQLDELYGRGCARGASIVVLGSLEKRIGFYVPGPARRYDTHVLGGVVPPWEGAPPFVAQVESRRVPLLDADHVLGAYLSVTGTLSTDQISGGVPEDEPEVTPRQATSREDVPAPPASPVGAGEGRDGRGEVLVVEQSEAMRETIASILSQRNIASACVSEVDEAAGIIDERCPRLIISEFRMPTMAAKRIVDMLKEKGSDIPVLVTTSQTGKTAELLVEKLGASGYLSKPLDAGDVAARVGAYIGEPAVS